MSCEDCLHNEVCALKEDFEKCEKDICRQDSFAMEYYNKRGFFVPVLHCKKYAKDEPKCDTETPTLNPAWGDFGGYGMTPPTPITPITPDYTKTGCPAFPYQGIEVTCQTNSSNESNEEAEL